MDKAPQLPALNEFTVGQLGEGALLQLLSLVRDKSGARSEVVEHIRQRWFSDSAAARMDPAERHDQQIKRAGNVVSGMRQAGLLTDIADPLTLTPLGEELLALSNEAAIARFGTFLLREKHGYEMLQFAADVRAREGAVSKNAVDKELRARGFRVPSNSSYSGKLRGWLQLAGVVNGAWEVDEAAVALLMGVKPTEVNDWMSLTTVQRDFLEILRRRDVGNRQPISSPDLLTLARQYGVSFDDAQVKRTVYEPLARLGWIVHEVKTAGRGGKGGSIAITAKARDFDSTIAAGLDLGTISNELQAAAVRPLADILDDLESDDTYVKGVALELLALRIAAEAGLTPVQLRLRGVTTGGAEVDLVAEGVHLHFSRWLFQCKNQKSPVGLQVLAKELGMALLLKAHVVVIVTTSRFAKSARDYAKVASETTSTQLILLDGTSLREYRRSGAASLRSEFHESALAAVNRKREQLLTVPLLGT